jgi:hypothetical protein
MPFAHWWARRKGKHGKYGKGLHWESAEFSELLKCAYCCRLDGARWVKYRAQVDKTLCTRCAKQALAFYREDQWLKAAQRIVNHLKRANPSK